MNTLAPAIAGLAAALLSPLVAPAASAAAPAPGGHLMVCTRSGHVSLSPGVTATEAREFTFTETGEFSRCNGPDGQMLSTTFAHDVGSGSGRCGLVSGTIPAAPLEWSNGRASAILTPADPSGCLGSGLAESDYVGEIRFQLSP